MAKFAILFVLATMCVLPQAMAAGTSPIGFSVLAVTESIYLQYPSPKTTVCGLRIGLIRSENKKACGIDLGVIWSTTSQNFTGLEFTVMANRHNHADIWGLQFGGILNAAKSQNVYGVQMASFYNYIEKKGDIYGLQFALAGNHGYSTVVHGVQFAAINTTAGIFGLQVGLYNVAAVVRGIQIGVINVATQSLKGIQIGALNFNSGGPLVFMPGINIGF